MKYLIGLGICHYLIGLGIWALFKYELLVHANDLVIKIKFLQPSNNVTTKEESNSNRLYQLSSYRIEILLKYVKYMKLKLRKKEKVQPKKCKPIYK